jgi:hypothetical protein
METKVIASIISLLVLACVYLGYQWHKCTQNVASTEENKGEMYDEEDNYKNPQKKAILDLFKPMFMAKSPWING